MNWFMIILIESMEGCAIATLEKCIATYDDERPKNMIEVSDCSYQYSLLIDWSNNRQTVLQLH